MGIKHWFAKVTGQEGESEPPRTAAPTEADILSALERVDAIVDDGAVPSVVESRVLKVTGRIRETLPRLRNLGPGSPEAYSVIATATDYLPEAVGGYLRLPREWADSRPIEGGKTSLMLLINQLDLLGSTMDKIFDAVVHVDAAALVAHGRFLQEKFGSGAPSTPPQAPQQTRPPSTPRSTLDLP
jgi:hypothetical protein